MLSSRKNDLELPKRDNRSSSPYSPSFKSGRHGSVSPPKHRHLGRRDRDNLSPRAFEKSHSYSKNHSNHFTARKQRFRELHRGTGGSSLKHSQKASNHSRYPSHGGRSHDYRSAPSPKKPRQLSPPPTSGSSRKRSSHADRHGASSKTGVEKECGKVTTKKEESTKSSHNAEQMLSPVKSLKPFLEDIDSDEDMEMVDDDTKPMCQVSDDKGSKLGPATGLAEGKEGEPSKRLMKEELFQVMEQLESDITVCEQDLRVAKAKQSLLEGVEYRYQVPTHAAFTSTLDDVRHILDAPCDDGALYKKIYRENKTHKTKLGNTVGKGSPFQKPSIQYHQPWEVPGYWEVIERHQGFRSALLQHIAKRRKEQFSMEVDLCERYDALSEQWEKRLERLERKAKDHKTRELFEKVFPELKRIKEPSEKLNRTDSRGIGIIRSEAELNELMDALNEQEESKDRHRRCHAVIPPMVIHPAEQKLKFVNRNGLLKAPLAAHKEHVDTCLNSWNEEETLTFKRVYALYPKNFEKISKFLPKKTVQQCVQFYYLTKKKDNYKVYVQAVKEERRKRGLSKGVQESPTSPHEMLHDAKETSDIQPVPGLSRRPTLLKPKIQRSYSTGSPYGDWSLEEIGKLKDGLRMHGKAWWKVSQVVGSKNQNRCRAFFGEFQSAKGLQLKEALEEYMKSKSNVRLRRKVEPKLVEPPPVGKCLSKSRSIPKMKQEVSVESGDDSSETGSSSDSSDTHTAVSSEEEPEEEQVQKPVVRQRRTQLMRSLSVPRRFSEDSLDVLFTAAEIVEGATVPSDIALHDHTYALSQRILYHNMDTSPTSGLSLIAAAAAVVSPSLQSSSSSVSPLLAPVKAPRGRPPNSSKRANHTSQRLQPTFLSPAGTNLQVPLTDQKGGARARSRSTSGSRPVSTGNYSRSTTPRYILSPTKPKPATPSNLPSMLPVAKPFNTTPCSNTPTTPSTPSTAFEALVNAAVAAPPASVPEKSGEGEVKTSTKESSDSTGSSSPLKSSSVAVQQKQPPLTSNTDTMQPPYSYNFFSYYPSSSGSTGQQWMPQFPFQFFYPSNKVYPQQATYTPMSVLHPVHMPYSQSAALTQAPVLPPGSVQSPVQQHTVPVQGHVQPTPQLASVGQSTSVPATHHEEPYGRGPGNSVTAQKTEQGPSDSQPSDVSGQSSNPTPVTSNSVSTAPHVPVNSTSTPTPPLNPTLNERTAEWTNNTEKVTNTDTYTTSQSDTNTLSKGVMDNVEGIVKENSSRDKKGRTLHSSDKVTPVPTSGEMMDSMNSQDSKMHLEHVSEGIGELSKLLNHHSLASELGQDDSEVEEELKNSDDFGSILPDVVTLDPPNYNLPSTSLEFNHERFSPNMAAMSLFSSISSSHSNDNTPSPTSSKVTDTEDAELKMDTNTTDHS